VNRLTCEHVGAHTRARVKPPSRGGDRGCHGEPLRNVQWVCIAKYSNISMEGLEMVQI
jgi:hypothetical protein